MTEKPRSLREELRVLFGELDHELASALTEQEQKTPRQSLLKVHGYLAAADTKDRQRGKTMKSLRRLYVFLHPYRIPSVIALLLLIAMVAANLLMTGAVLLSTCFAIPIITCQCVSPWPSALIRLLPRFYDVSSGHISFDSVDVRELDPIELRSHIGIALQEAILFSSSIADNIRVDGPHRGAAWLFYSKMVM